MTKIIELIGSLQLINLTSMWNVCLAEKKQKTNHKKETCDLQDNFLDYVSTY